LGSGLPYRDRALVGAYLDGARGEKLGVSYVCDILIGEQIAQLEPSDNVAGDWLEFG
jgi:hypothetical protein